MDKSLIMMKKSCFTNGVSALVVNISGGLMSWEYGDRFAKKGELHLKYKEHEGPRFSGL